MKVNFYDMEAELPPNCKFLSLGKRGVPQILGETIVNTPALIEIFATIALAYWEDAYDLAAREFTIELAISTASVEGTRTIETPSCDNLKKAMSQLIRWKRIRDHARRR